MKYIALYGIELVWSELFSSRFSLLLVATFPNPPIDLDHRSKKKCISPFKLVKYNVLFDQKHQ